MKVTFTVTNNNPDTIWNQLAKRLGREPTNQEITQEIERILNRAPAND
jgi:hypothetical protein